MPFNIEFSGVDFEDAEFTKSDDSEDSLPCNFFPKNAAEEALRKISIANSLLITFEQAILLGPRPEVIGFQFNVENEVNQMAESRCELLESLAGIFCGERVNGRCLAEGLPSPGVRFVNCDSLENPTTFPINPAADCDRPILVSWLTESTNGTNSFDDQTSLDFTENVQIENGDIFEIRLRAEIIAPDCINADFVGQIPVILRHSFVTNPVLLSDRLREQTFTLSALNGFTAEQTASILSFRFGDGRFAFTVTVSYPQA